MSDGMGRESAYLSSHATNRYFISNWGTNYISDWPRLHDMRNDIVHKGYTTQHLAQAYIEKTIEEARLFLKKVENV